MSAPIQAPGLRSCDELTTGGVLLTLAATTLGLALQHSSGTVSDIGIAGLTLAFAEAWASQGRWRSKATGSAAAIAGLCIGAEVAMLLTDDAARLGGNAGPIFIAIVVAAGAVAGLCFVVRRNLHARLLAGVVLLAASAGWWLLRHTPVAAGDALSFRRFAGATLLSGDIRYASLAAVIMAACLIGFARPSWSSILGATLLLLSPSVPAMIRNGWTDSFVVLFVAAAWFCQCRRPTALPYVIGLLFASRLYLMVAAALVLLLIDRPWLLRKLWSFAWRAGIAGLVVTPMFALMDPTGFASGVLTHTQRQPLRSDALSYIALLSPADQSRWNPLPFMLSVVTGVAILRRPSAKPAPFSAALALTMLAFFAFNAQALLNHYFLALGCMCCAIAGDNPPRREPEPRTYLPGARGDVGLRLL